MQEKDSETKVSPDRKKVGRAGWRKSWRGVGKGKVWLSKVSDFEYSNAPGASELARPPRSKLPDDSRVDVGASTASAQAFFLCADLISRH